MNTDEPGLFDLPDRVRLASPKRSMRGRNREAWTRTATAEVTILDTAALHEAVARMEGNAVTIGLRAGPEVEEIDPGENNPEVSGRHPPTTRSGHCAG